MSDHAPKRITEDELWTAPVGRYNIVDEHGQFIEDHFLGLHRRKIGIVREPPRGFMDELPMLNCEDGLQRGTTWAHVAFMKSEDR